MAGRKIDIEEKIRAQKNVVSRMKDKYDASVAELEKLMAKREEMQKRELMEAFSKSSRSYEEVMEFLKTGNQKAAD